MRWKPENRDVPVVKLLMPKGRNYWQLRYQDPKSKKWRQVSTGTQNRVKAERMQYDLRIELENGWGVHQITWEDFRTRFTTEHLSGLAKRTQENWRTAANWLERLIEPGRLAEIDAATLVSFASRLRGLEKAEVTIAAYLRWILVSLSWAHQIDLIPEVPKVKMPHRAKGIRKSMRSRPITGEEFDRILSSVARVRKQDSAAWTRFLKGLWHSGFRIQELLRLSWDPAESWYVDESHAIPCVRILADSQKSHEDQFQPITKEFWDLLTEDLSSKWCFLIPNRQGDQMKVKSVGRVISKIGAAAGVVTNVSEQKMATSHDIGRRAFATRMSGKLSMAELSEWMRHASSSTTMSYYHAPQVEQLARKVWDE